jgi:hypothetical protein
MHAAALIPSTACSSTYSINSMQQHLFHQQNAAALIPSTACPSAQGNGSL